MKNLKNYLHWVGWLFVVIGILGYLVGSSWAPSLIYWPSESLGYLAVGLILLAAKYWGKTADLLKWLTVLVGLGSLYLAVYGWAISSNFYGLASLETLDNVLFLIVGLWALKTVWGKK